MRAKACSTRARTLRCSALSASSPARRGRPGRLRDDESGVDVGAVAQHGHVPAVLGQAGFSPHAGVCPVAGRGPGSGDDQFRGGVDDDLHIRREPSVAAGGTDLPVTDRDQCAVHDPQPVGGIGQASDRLDGQHRTELLDHPAHGRRRDAEQWRELPHGEVRAVVDSHQQHPVRQRQAPRTTDRGPSPPRSRTAFSSPSNCRIRSPVNVSTHNGSTLNTAPMQGKCPNQSLMQHALGARTA